MKRARPGVQPVDEVKTVSIMIHLSFLTLLALAIINPARTRISIKFERTRLLTVRFQFMVSICQRSSFVCFPVQCWCLSVCELPSVNAFLTPGDWQVNYAGGPSHPQNNVSPDDLPKTVARSLNQGSCVMSMDFHPIQQSVLLGKYLRSLVNYGLQDWDFSNYGG